MIGLALAYGATGCGSNSDQSPSDMPGAGGAGTSTGGGATIPPPPGSGATGATPPPTTGSGGMTVVGGGGTPPLGGAGTTPITGGGGTPTTGGGGTPTTGGGGTPAVGGGSSTGGDTGAAGTNGVGCGQGTFCMPGDDLAPPAASDGFQIVSPASISVPPGDEQFWCYYKNIPGTGEVDVGGFRSWMTGQSSHHFITFHSTTPGADGNLVSCPFGSGDWVYATSKSAQVIGMDLPAGVGLPFQAGSQLIMNMHLINTGTDTVKPVIKLNVLFAKNVQYKAGSVFSLAANAQINVAPNATQTVRGSCTAPAGSKFFLWTTHSHKFTTEDDVNYVSGGQTTNIVKTTDWESPGTHVWGPPDFLTVKAGDSFTYSCTYKNTLTRQLTFGETAAYNEMCLAIGYYFPAGGASCL
jgi:hypothetical protein